MTYLPKIIPVAYGATDFGFLSFCAPAEQRGFLNCAPNVCLCDQFFVCSAVPARVQLCLPLAHSTEGRDRGVYLFLVLNLPLAALQGINMSMFSVFTD